MSRTTSSRVRTGSLELLDYWMRWADGMTGRLRFLLRCFLFHKCIRWIDAAVYH